MPTNHWRLAMSNLYYTYWKGEKHNLLADTSYQAQQLSVEVFAKRRSASRKKVKRSDITVVLVAVDGEQVVHNPAILD